MLMYIGRKYEFLLSDIKNTYNDLNYIVDYEINIIQSLTRLLEPNISKIIIELDCIKNSNEEILDSLKQLKKLNSNLPLGIIAVGYPSKSEFIRQIKKIGFNNIYATLNENNNIEIKDFIIEFCFDDLTEEINEILSDTELFNLSKKIDESLNSPLDDTENKFTTIGILGTKTGIGTTTQALQLVKYLQYNNFTSCYLELNTTNYIDNLIKLYNTNKNDDSSLIYNNIFLYNSIEDIPYIKNNFQYCVVDYGYFSKNTYIPSFIEKDIKICVCGFKPNEYQTFQKLFKEMNKYHDIHYIFSFISTSEQKEILQLFENCGGNVQYIHFAEFSPDPFVYNPETNKFYKQIISKSNNPITKKSIKSKKFNIFKRK